MLTDVVCRQGMTPTLLSIVQPGAWLEWLEWPATVLAAIEPVAVELQTNVPEDYARFYQKGQVALRHYSNHPADPL